MDEARRHIVPPDPVLARLAAAGIAVKTIPDIRWGRCDIKTVMLLPAGLANDFLRQSGN